MNEHCKTSINPNNYMLLIAGMDDGMEFIFYSTLDINIPEINKMLKVAILSFK